MQNLFGEKKDDENIDGVKANNKGKSKSEMNEPKSFEQAIAELEEIVQKLDSGEIPLEESIVMFERAQFLAKWCRDILDKIEGKLKILMPDNEGGFSVEPMDEINS